MTSSALSFRSAGTEKGNTNGFLSILRPKEGATREKIRQTRPLVYSGIGTKPGK